MNRPAVGDFGSVADAGVSGAIFDSGGNAVSNVRVEARNVSRGYVVANTWTNIAGQYHLTHLPRGEYEIVAYNGLNEVRGRVSVLTGSTELSLRFSTPARQVAGDPYANTVSANDLEASPKARKALRKAQDALSSGNLGRVAKYVAKALAIDPNYGEALTLDAFLKLQNQNVDAARDDLEKALHYNPNYPMTYFLLAATYNQGERFEDALRTADAGLRLAPRAWQGHFEMSKALLAKKQFMEALRHASKALELGANLPLLHLVKGDAFAGLEDYANAIVEMQAYLSAEPGSPASEQVRGAIEKLKVLASRAQPAPAVGAFVSH